MDGRQSGETSPPGRGSLPPAQVQPQVYLQCRDFLPKDRHATVLAHALLGGERFTPSTVDTSDSQHRRSLVDYDVALVAGILLPRIEAVLPQIMGALGVRPQAIGQIECQLTAHNDGHFYKLHNDNGTPGTRARILSYVYYFHQEPKPFSGGELQIYHSRVENGFWVAAERSEIVTPHNNSIVFFESHHHHQVLPVTCASGAFIDSRFTVNGWVRHA